MSRYLKALRNYAGFRGQARLDPKAEERWINGGGSANLPELSNV